MSPRPLPLELWEIIIHRLLEDGTPRQLVNLSRTCWSLYQITTPLLYRSVLLRSANDSLLFARTIKEQDSLAALVRELRHDDNAGFKVYEDASVDLYACLIDLPNVETLAMRMRGSCLPLESPLHHPDQYMMLFPFEESIYAMFDLDCAKAGVGDARKALQRAREQDPNGDIRWAVVPTRTWTEVSLSRPVSGRPPDSQLFDRVSIANERLANTFAEMKTGHIGSDYNCELGQTGDMRFDHSIFCHPTLEKLCITNGRMDALYRVKESLKPPASSTALKELTLLNCNISPYQLSLAMKYPKALKKFTYRGVSPDAFLSLNEPDDDAFDYTSAMEAQESSLESVDMDIYWGYGTDMDFWGMQSLKNLTVTPYVLTGAEPSTLSFDEMLLPASIESLTLRLENGLDLHFKDVHNLLIQNKLPNLRSFTCQIPDNLEAMWTGARLSENGLRYGETFKDLGVALSVVQVPYPTTMPDYEVCSCERLEYYHRFPVHRIEDVPDFPMIDDDDPYGDDPPYLYDIDFSSPDVEFSGDPDEMMDYYW